jgi:hypothetical protein
VDGGAGAVLLLGAAGVDEVAVVGGAADGLDDEEQPATAARTISAAAS